MVFVCFLLQVWSTSVIKLNKYIFGDLESGLFLSMVCQASGPLFPPLKSSCRFTLQQRHLPDHENKVTRNGKAGIRDIQNEHRVICHSHPPTPAASFPPFPSTHPGCPYHLHSSPVPESTHHLTPPWGKTCLHVKHAATGSLACRHISRRFPPSRTSSLTPSGSRAQL